MTLDQKNLKVKIPISKKNVKNAYLFLQHKINRKYELPRKLTNSSFFIIFHFLKLDLSLILVNYTLINNITASTSMRLYCTHILRYCDGSILRQFVLQQYSKMTILYSTHILSTTQALKMHQSLLLLMF